MNVSNVRIIRAMRITRLIRTLRIPRLIRFIGALRTFVYSILCTLHSLVWAIFLLMIIIYIFAVSFTQAANDYLLENDDGTSQINCPYLECTASQLEVYWGSLFSSMFTLYKTISGGISWHDVVTPLGEIHPFYAGMFTAFITFTYFAVLNVVTGVFCQSAIDSAQRDPDMMVQSLLSTKKMYTEKITQLFQKIDGENVGEITLMDLQTCLKDDQALAYFEALDIDASNAWTLFKHIDLDKSNAVELNEFIEGCLKLKGTAKCIDVASLIEDHRVMAKRLTKFICYVEKRFAALTGVPHHTRL